MLEESEAHYEHQREVNISLVADAVRSSTRRKSNSIRASFEKTLKYNYSQSAEKGVKTRRKNAKAEAKPQPQPQSQPTTQDGHTKAAESNPPSAAEVAPKL